jgi:NitT/TauT family transport system permease protein
MYYSPIPTTHLKKYPISAGDLAVFGLVILAIYGSIAMAHRWTQGLVTNATIELGTTNLLAYSLFSLYRALIAYAISFVFTIATGYAAAKNALAERIILPLLDIGQSIPVLGFLPGLVLGLISLFPKSNTGLELACILMIFTGQAWNMAFGFYASLKSVPTHFHELSQNICLSRVEKLKRVELPFSASGLAWNSLMSMAGGWFFLTVCEAFTLGKEDFRIPGLGSYMALAIEKGDKTSMIEGVVAMVLVIVLMDFVFWRPIVAWTRKFRLDEQSDEAQNIPFMQLLYEDSKFRALLRRTFRLVIAVGHFLTGIFQKFLGFFPRPKGGAHAKWHWAERLGRIPGWVVFLLISPVIVNVVGKLYLLLAPLKADMVLAIGIATLKTFGRVVFAIVVSTAWAVPFGIWVGMSSRLTRFFQPLVQIAASFPAPMLYPIALGVLRALHIQIGFGSAILMLLGVQWYVLFNVLAGATNISRELRETFNLIGLSKTDMWKNLYLPSVLPSLVTGLITAAGGAWNASIVAEYIQYEGNTLTAQGLGSLISEATAKGDYALLGGSLLAMVVVVVALNNIVWRPFYELVARRYRFER